MAKVTNQVYDGSEVNYIDEAGIEYHMGEFFRKTLTDPYPLPQLNPSGVVRKSPRVSKPPTRGRGSRLQGPYRDCFQQCAERWNKTPDECPINAPCLLITSKKSVWDAKQDQGVMCSYYDLFMGCCMSFCEKSPGKDADGNDITIGTIPPSLPCFPCDPPCLGSTLQISYTTDQMEINQSQALTVWDSLFGDTIPCCDPGGVAWEIFTGGGSLSSSTGMSTIYTAPGSNGMCAQNAEIKLSDCCGRSATLFIVINEYSEEVPAYYTWESVQIGGVCEWNRRRHAYTCSGILKPEWDCDVHCVSYAEDCKFTYGGDFYCTEIGVIAWCQANGHCGPSCIGIIDVRTPEMISMGCCPRILF